MISDVLGNLGGKIRKSISFNISDSCVRNIKEPNSNTGGPRYGRLRVEVIFETHSLIYEYPWSVYTRAHLLGPYLSHITRVTSIDLTFSTHLFTITTTVKLGAQEQPGPE